MGETTEVTAFAVWNIPGLINNHHRHHVIFNPYELVRLN